VAFSPDQTRGSYRVFSLKRLSASSVRIVEILERRFEFLRGGAILCGGYGNSRRPGI
jgi:hypothetical protein